MNTDNIVSYLLSYPVKVEYADNMSNIISIFAIIASLVIGVFSPYVVLFFQNRDLGNKIKESSSREIYSNYYSIIEGGITEIEIEKQQFNTFNSNIRLFSKTFINKSANKMRLLYNIFNLYEFTWKSGNNGYFIQEVKLRSKIYLLHFLEILDDEDLKIIQITCDLVLSLGKGKPLVNFLKLKDEADTSDSELMKHIKSQMINIENFINMNRGVSNISDLEFPKAYIVFMFDQYLNTKYKPETLDIQDLIICKLKQK